MICDKDTKEMVGKFQYDGEVYLYEELVKNEIEDVILQDIRRKTLDIDPIYIVFTSSFCFRLY